MQVSSKRTVEAVVQDFEEHVKLNVILNTRWFISGSMQIFLKAGQIHLKSMLYILAQAKIIC
jgi:hypothetical protein